MTLLKIPNFPNDLLELRPAQPCSGRNIDVTDQKDIGPTDRMREDVAYRDAPQLKLCMIKEEREKMLQKFEDDDD